MRVALHVQKREKSTVSTGQAHGATRASCDERGR